MKNCEYIKVLDMDIKKKIEQIKQVYGINELDNNIFSASNPIYHYNLYLYTNY